MAEWTDALIDGWTGVGLGTLIGRCRDGLKNGGVCK